MKIINIITAVSLLAGFAAATTAFAVSDNSVSGKSDKKITISELELNENGQIDFQRYGINEKGKSYGVVGSAPDGGDPDMVSVIGDNLTAGYCYKEDLDREMPSCPEEAVKMMEEREKAGNPPRVINVYKSDGETVIDTFTIGDRTFGESADFNNIDYSAILK